MKHHDDSESSESLEESNSNPLFESIEAYNHEMNHLLDQILQSIIYLYLDPSDCIPYTSILTLRKHIEEQFQTEQDLESIGFQALLLLEKTREIHTHLLTEAERQHPLNKKVIEENFNWFFPVMILLEKRVENDPNFNYIFHLLKNQIDDFRLDNHALKNVEYSKHLRDYTRQLSDLIQNTDFEPNKCGICRTEINEPLVKVSPCQHPYHYNCLNDWFLHATLRISGISNYTLTMVCPICGEGLHFLVPV